MRRSALRDRNDESGVDAIARIKAIAAGKTSRSAFLDDSDVECSPSAHPVGGAENKENAERMSDSDEDYSPAQPVRRKKNRLVRKSQLEAEEAEAAESLSPSPLPKARPRRAVIIDSDSDSEAEDVAKTDDEDAGDDALVDAMRGLEVKKSDVAPQPAPAPFAPRPTPFAPVAPATRPPPAKAPSVPAPAPKPSTPKPAKSKPATPASSRGVPCVPSGSSRASVRDDPDPSGGPRPMRLKGREGGPRFELAGALASRLYDHQRDGVRWMWNLQLQGRGGILADDMGLGKTLQVAAFAAGLLRSRAAKRVLCLAPTTLLPHWGKEFVVAGLVEGVNLFKYAGGGSKSERDKALRAVTERGGVLLSTYGMVTHNDVALGAPEAEEDAERVAAASGRGAAVSGQDMPESARGLLWDWIVCDEGHKLKNPAAQLPTKLRTLPCSHRLVITGTPIQNDLNELWALYDLCCPGLLGDAQEFRREFAKRVAAGQSRDATERQRSAGARASDELRKLCRPFMLRREKNAVLAKAKAERDAEEAAGGASGGATAAPGTPSAAASGAPRTSIEASTTGWAGVKHAPTQLGKKNDLVVWIPMKPAQKRLYRAFLDSSVVRRALNKTGSALAAINVLKKICDHPALCAAMTRSETDGETVVTELAGGAGDAPEDVLREDDPDADAAGAGAEGKREAVLAAIESAGLTPGDLEGDTDASGKAAFLRELLRGLTNNGHRVLVFSQSIKMLDVVERAAREDGHALVRIDGRVPAEERHARVERFQASPDIPLALLTTQVGGLGLTLTAADRVVIYDPSWNPAADNQSVDRAYRIGQTRDVVVYRLVTCGTVEEKVYRRQVFKGGLSRAGTRDGNHFRYFSADDTSGLFECTDAGLESSETQKELEALHSRDRAWTEELRETEAPMVRALGAAGLSDHDLLFTKEDTTKAGEGASTLKGGGAFGGGATPGGGGGVGKGAGAGKGKGGGWKGVDSGWGGDAQLGMLAAAAGSALAATPASFAVAAKAKNPLAAFAEPRGANANAPAVSPANATKRKATEKLRALRLQKEKQETLLDMPGMLKRLPDKGKSIVERIDALTAEIETLEAEVAAKHGTEGGETRAPPASPAVAAAAEKRPAPTPATVLVSPAPSSRRSSGAASETVSLLPSPEMAIAASEPSDESRAAVVAASRDEYATTPEPVHLPTETRPSRGSSLAEASFGSEDSFRSAASSVGVGETDATVELDATVDLDATAPLEEVDTTAEEEQVDTLADMMGTVELR